MGLHEIPMPMMWQIEWFVSIYNAVHDTRIVHTLGKFILNVYLYVHDLAHLYIWYNWCIIMIHGNVEILLKNQYGWIEYS